MRIREALGIRAEVIDLDAGVIEINATAVRLNDRAPSYSRCASSKAEPIKSAES